MSDSTPQSPPPMVITLDNIRAEIHRLGSVVADVGGRRAAMHRACRKLADAVYEALDKPRSVKLGGYFWGDSADAWPYQADGGEMRTCEKFITNLEAGLIERIVAEIQATLPDPAKEQTALRLAARLSEKPDETLLRAADAPLVRPAEPVTRSWFGKGRKEEARQNA